MQSELKPCPFCGGDPTPDFSSIIGEDAYHFHCQSGVCPAWPNVSGATEAEAIAAWNTRASDAEIARLTEALRAAEEREKALRGVDSRLRTAVTESLKQMRAAFANPNSLLSSERAMNAMADAITNLAAAHAALKEQPHADA